MVKRDLVRSLIVIIIGIVTIVFVGKLYFSMITVHPESANNTLKTNDVLIYNKRDKPKVNDFVVYKVNGKKYISRIIAIGGDSVTSMDDVLYINGVAKSEPYIERLKSAYLTETNHQSNFTTDFNLSTITHSSKAKIPKNHFLLLNDNRQNEQDSRQFGMISRKQIKGVLTFRLLPFKSFGFLED